MTGSVDSEIWEQAVGYTRRLLSHSKLTSIHSEHIRSVAPLLDADAYGINALDPSTFVSTAVAVDGLSEDFETLYDAAGGYRTDPFFQFILAKRRAVHDTLLYPDGDWTDRCPQFGDVLRAEGLSHILITPLVHRGAIVGTMHFSRSDTSGPFSKRDVRTASLCSELAAPIVGFAQERVRLEEAWAATRMMARDIPRPIVLSDLSGQRICKSERASQLYDAIPDARGRLQLDLAIRENVSKVERDRDAARTAWNTIDIETRRVTGARTIFITYLDEQCAPRLDTTALIPPLTRREAEVLEAVALGMRDREAGNTLGISVNTVKQHLKSIYRKLDARGRADAVRQALIATSNDNSGGQREG